MVSPAQISPRHFGALDFIQRSLGHAEEGNGSDIIRPGEPIWPIRGLGSTLQKASAARSAAEPGHVPVGIHLSELNGDHHQIRPGTGAPQIAAPAKRFMGPPQGSALGEPAKLLGHPLIDLALERNHQFHRPIQRIPAPGAELGLVGAAARRRRATAVAS